MTTYYARDIPARRKPQVDWNEHRRIRAMFDAEMHINDVHRETGRSFETLKRMRDGK